MSSCGEAVVGEIHRAVGADVALDAGQQRETLEPLIDLADRARMRQGAGFVEAVGHGQRLAVIGDGQVVQPGGLCGAGHALDVVAAVGRRRMAVQVAPQIRELDQLRQRAALGGLDLAAVLAQFGRHVRESQRCVDPRLVLAGDARVVVDLVQAVLVQLEPALDRAVAQDDVVRLRAGEVPACAAPRLSRGNECEGRPGIRPTAARSTWCRRARARARPGGSP